jgi:class 3 adenylate cyclase
MHQQNSFWRINAHSAHRPRSSRPALPISMCSSLRVTGWISWCGIVATPERTPLPEIDRSAAAAFWQRYLATVGEEIGASYTDVACFGDSIELADELINLVLGGQLASRPIQIRVGMAAGEPIQENGDVHGAVVVQASRIADLGKAGEVIVSDSIRQLAVGKEFEFQPRGGISLKGFEEAQRVWTETRSKQTTYDDQQQRVMG